MTMLDPQLATAETQAKFDLTEFGRALERGDLDYLVAAYAHDAEVRLTDPDTPPLAPRVLRGRKAIADWLEAEVRADCSHRVVRLVEGKDRVAYTEERQHLDGTHEVAASTAELRNGVIGLQHTLLVWDRWE
jgi:ketosteroid isomerase-like protein